MKSLKIKVSDIEDLYRKTYQDIIDFIQESSLKKCLDIWSEDSEFRYAVLKEVVQRHY